ncbi:class I SAM-dependent methyltransferase [Murimonas intestini]|uniref:Methyltransferase family protein n=1 Tax=Murimonas intestini TaxID=1337051 RepID=A0AB73T922_9FIRM|nr:class I SAM-dependent methyltransferase [Murimonas intestini]MCR1839449.1 methyltransferase [Murimonas intestini]MCR1864744.1 methyltransferase [Murimonas intestini]MCR1882354.1 methyltransferase [Murimonas intestini]
MEEQIGKVKLDYTFYQGADSYSDGDIENVLLNWIKKESDVNRIIREDSRWPVLYHFSPVRQSIVQWYPFRKNASVLEIGAGCGAVTGALCGKAAEVTCVELSKRRSLINAHRNKECGNLKIMVGNFNDILFQEKFDYITLIGVLEYAAYYTAADQPFRAFLENIGALLKPDGKVLIAIENRYGLKYWAGCREDHTGRFFDGLEGYRQTDSMVRTFGKDEITEIIKDAGYSTIDFYYPFPDYKFPSQIFSDDYMPKAEDLVCALESYDSDRLRLFDETAVFQDIVESGKFDFFSNSFFIEIGRKTEEKDLEENIF